MLPCRRLRGSLWAGENPLPLGCRSLFLQGGLLKLIEIIKKSNPAIFLFNWINQAIASYYLTLKPAV